MKSLKLKTNGMLVVLALSTLVLNSCKNNDDDSSPSSNGSATNVLYVQSNNPGTNQNSVIAYKRDGGSLSLIAGSPFLSGGAGVGNPNQILGPDDSDQNLIVSPDHKRLFSVNSGSNTIAVFNIASDGSLTAVEGSPFASGGTNPVSLGIANNYLYVVNKNQDPNQSGGGTPNYTVMKIANDGSLTQVSGSTINTAVGVSPTQALVSPNKMLLFGTDFFGPANGLGTLRSFKINGDGTLTNAAGSPKKLNGPDSTGAALGLANHPTENILYVGHVMRDTLGIYTYDNNGMLTYVKGVKNTGKAICWVTINKSGSRIYTSNTGDGSVSFYNNSNPMSPSEVQKITLNDLGPAFVDGMNKPHAISSAPFQLALDPTEKYLYVICQRSTTDASYTSGNILHVLSVGIDGMLSEPNSNVDLPVPANARPQGVLVF